MHNDDVACRPIRRLLGMMLVLLGACGGDSTAPIVRPDTALHFLQLAPTSPAIATPTASFWAKAGQNGGIDLWFHPAAGRSDSTKFMEFRIGGSSRLSRPDGSAFAKGDSVLITVTLSDPSKLILDFQPSGLRFSPDDLPTLKIFFGNCDNDLNGDGVVNAADDALASQLAIWKRETATDPWVQLSSLELEGTKEVDARVDGFTGYAIAF